MLADIITAGGIGCGAIRDTLAVDQVIIRDRDGNALAVAFTSGDLVIVSTEKDRDFPSILARLGERPPQIIRLNRK